MSGNPQPDAAAMQNLFQAGQAFAQGVMNFLAQPSAARSPQAALGAQFAQNEAIASLQKEFAARHAALWQDMLRRGQGGATAEVKDKRFAAPEWSGSPFFDYLRQAYLLNADYIGRLIEALPMDDEAARSRLQFFTSQFVDAMAPSNFVATNPEFIRTALDTQGASITAGIRNLLDDLGKGRISMTDEAAFEVGRNLAVTPGQVIFENALIQLIQYDPETPKVHARPLVIVPPCINKFYILDLQPDNSVIRYAVSQGHRTFVVSWRNPDESLGHKTWDDYIEDGVLKAVSTVQDICEAPQINVLGFCVGGTMVSTAMAVLAARHAREHGELPAARPARSRAAAAKTGSRTAAAVKTQAQPFPVASMTLLTTLIDFRDTGILDIFIDENMVRLREMQMGKGGLMKGQDMASTFSFLRPNDLVWNYVVGNYLKGETPPPFDLLYWNSDSTNLPGPFYAWYLRNLYLENNLIKPGVLTVCGEKIDMGQLKMPVYIYGSREDHIVPVGAAYASSQVLGGELRFVMGASGHIAGVINPPAKNKRSHWLREDGEFPESFSDWLADATEYPGSWWTDWSAWLGSHAGKQLAAPRSYGRARAYAAIEEAPGRYVLSKA